MLFVLLAFFYLMYITAIINTISEVEFEITKNGYYITFFLSIIIIHWFVVKHKKEYIRQIYDYKKLSAKHRKKRDFYISIIIIVSFISIFPIMMLSLFTI